VAGLAPETTTSPGPPPLALDHPASPHARDAAAVTSEAARGEAAEPSATPCAPAEACELAAAAVAGLAARAWPVPPPPHAALQLERRIATDGAAGASSTAWQPR